ncbi:MAG: leucine-rich repeat domain-containing protein [Bacteroidales bacterium]|nr:leucine-rich repeat domain-containing protein [Bacteroidales bacterium]
MRKTITLFLLLAGLCMHAMAFDFLSGGIYYKITSVNTVKVTYFNTNYNSYSGSVNVPSTVSYGGETYTVNEIDSAAFALSSGLTSVTLPNTIVRIDSSAFVLCDYLQSVNIPSSVRYIGSAAFSGTAISSITIPDSVQFIGGGQFYGCSLLTSITYNAINATHGRYYDIDPQYHTISYLPNMGYCTSLTTVTIGSNVRSIPRAFFENAPSLGTIVIPDNVTSIGDSAFYHCQNLTNVQIGSGVISIGNYAFHLCGINSLSVRATTPPTLGNYVFSGVSNTIPVTVPCQSIRTYRTTSGWNYFTNITGGAACEANVNIVIVPTLAGTPTGAGRCIIGDTVEIGVIPASGYVFDQWNDGVTTNPRNIIVVHDTTFTAYFNSHDGLADANDNGTLIMATNRTISAFNIRGGEFAIYDLGGRCLVRRDVAEGSEESFRVPAAGVYVVRNNENSVKIVVR